MATFAYKAKIKSNGATSRGTLDAPNQDAAMQRLQSNGLEVLSIKQKAENTGMALKMPGTSGVSCRDLVVFSRQLSTMIDSVTSPSSASVAVTPLSSSSSPQPVFTSISCCAK